MFGTVGPFRQDTERHAVMQGIYGLVDRLVVMSHFLQPVTHTVNRHDLQPVQDGCFLRILEDIRPGNKHFAPAVDTQHRQGVTERVRMVRRKDNRPVRRDIFPPDAAVRTVRTAEKPINVRP